MRVIDSDSETIRAVTAKIAQSYDLVPYNPQGIDSPGLDPAWILGLAALYRDTPQHGDLDVLDLGCGGGSQLVRAAAQASGRLVGVDISRTACDEAAARCAPLGARCQILCSDAFDLDVAALGQFDLIYLVGVYYVVPPSVQRRLRDVLSACLKPGGVVLMSYYSPGIWRHFDALRERLRAGTDLSAAPALQIEAARKIVRDLAAAPGRGGISEQVLDHALSCEASTFFHEMLGEVLAPVETAALAAMFAPAGIHFLNWMVPGPFTQAPVADARAAAADRTPGGYHYGVFAKYEERAPTWTGAIWQTDLRRAGTGPTGAVVYRDSARGIQIEVANPATVSALDRLAAGPRPWNELREGLAALSPNGKADALQIEAVMRDFLSLWQNGLLTPQATLTP